MILSNGTQLRTGTVAHVPNFHGNLLSVHETTRNEKCTVTLDEYGDVIVAGRINTENRTVMRHIQKNNRMYAITGSVLASAQKGSANNANENRPINHYFRLRKWTPKDAKMNSQAMQILAAMVVCTRTIVPKPSTRQRSRVRRVQKRTQLRIPNYLPGIPKHEQHKVSLGHKWHLQFNHTAPDTIRMMAKLHTNLGLPKSLKKGKALIRCAGCAALHMQRAPHRGHAL